MMQIIRSHFLNAGLHKHNQLIKLPIIHFFSPEFSTAPTSLSSDLQNQVCSYVLAMFK